MRAWRLAKDFERHKAAARSIQRLLRGSSVRRPQRLRLYYLRSIESLSMLKDARERLERSELVCPITKEVVNDPLVCLIDGFTYEREAITTWIEKVREGDERGMRGAKVQS